MRLVIFAVFDRGIMAFGPPQTIPHIGGATRWFGDSVSNKETPFGQHPEDYELYRLGTFDDNSGQFDVLATPELVVRGKDAVRSVQ